MKKFFLILVFPVFVFSQPVGKQSIDVGLGYSYLTASRDLDYFWDRGFNLHSAFWWNYSNKNSLVTILNYNYAKFDHNEWLKKDKNLGKKSSLLFNNAHVTYFAVSENIAYHFPARTRLSTSVDMGVGYFFIGSGTAAATDSLGKRFDLNGISRPGTQINFGWTVRFRFPNNQQMFVSTRLYRAFTKPERSSFWPVTFGFEF